MRSCTQQNSSLSINMSTWSGSVVYLWCDRERPPVNMCVGDLCVCAVRSSGCNYYISICIYKHIYSTAIHRCEYQLVRAANSANRRMAKRCVYLCCFFCCILTNILFVRGYPYLDCIHVFFVTCRVC